MTNSPQKPLLSGQFNPHKPCQLPQWGLIMVEGADAATFLQNQLSNSVLSLKVTQPTEVAKYNDAVRLIGYCNPKGRLLASAWVGLFPSEGSSEDRFGLFISADIASSVAKRLSMFVLRSKVKVLDVSSKYTISCLVGSDEQISGVSLGAEQLGLRLPDVLLSEQTLARILIADPGNNDLNFDEENLSNWNYLEVISAIPRIVLATQEQFVPQMINFESVAGVDFKKGCYPGQEIVARSQYRGAIKRRLQLAHCSTERIDLALLVPGTEIFHSDDPSQPAGMVVLASENPIELHRADLQIECKLDALESGNLYLGSSQGPVLKIDVLPYPLLEI
ncbi:folate-binding protein YgfZ [Polynucleobacter sp. AP-Kolm-20A-A1]|uniref:CAF17-like 4Fe-4S cluster assembly/insertion protein YgfZ n=1 Tax=Polynucleobacter sp. AP-Kolm-20A-A1 TaxID=2081041 RepID=UPI001BFDD59D|nr:folate-binding protein [Polynucleobacter sp. AP-Kolm-20A-A1]QWE21531.1 folate-binding protein YgfZ [Polynucleobacter sp. AP-Kolm-20A-A1]